MCVCLKLEDWGIAYLQTGYPQHSHEITWRKSKKRLSLMEFKRGAAAPEKDKKHSNHIGAIRWSIVS